MTEHHLFFNFSPAAAFILFSTAAQIEFCLSPLFHRAVQNDQYNDHQLRFSMIIWWALLDHLHHLCTHCVFLIQQEKKKYDNASFGIDFIYQQPFFFHQLTSKFVCLTYFTELFEWWMSPSSPASIARDIVVDDWHGLDKLELLWCRQRLCRHTALFLKTQ